MALQQINTTDIATGGALGSIGANNITATYLQTGAVETALTNNGTSFGMKNRIINGDIRINQRGNTSQTFTTSGGYIMDRWSVGWVTSGGFSASTSTDAPAGFANSCVITCTTATTANDWSPVQQIIEGNNVCDLNWGTSNGVGCTLSFWFKSSLTGTFNSVVKFYGGTSTYYYLPTFTYNSSGTWQYISVYIPPPPAAAGAIALPLTSAGIMVGPLTLTTTNTTTVAGNTWSTTGAYRATGAVTLMNTLNATMQFTGCQFEKGSVATPFEFRDIGRETLMCQRYYQSIIGGGTVYMWSYTAYYSTWRFVAMPLPVIMRATPTMAGTPASDSTYSSSSIVGVSNAHWTASMVMSGANSIGNYSSITASAEL
jgi:hypothetical protein